MQKVKCEILSRSISWVNQVDIRKLAPMERMVVDPRDGQSKDIQIVLRNLMEGWGQEHVKVLWKVLMVHSQSIEDRLLESFPETAIMTDAERRLTERARAEIEATTREVIDDQVARMFEADEEVKG
jgi:ribosomal protein S3AE